MTSELQSFGGLAQQNFQRGAETCDVVGSHIGNSLLISVILNLFRLTDYFAFETSTPYGNPLCLLHINWSYWLIIEFSVSWFS
jgi:hypothetical protein